MQLVTPKLVAMAVRMAIGVWKMNFNVSYFHSSLSISLRNILCSSPHGCADGWLRADICLCPRCSKKSQFSIGFAQFRRASVFPCLPWFCLTAPESFFVLCFCYRLLRAAAPAFVITMQSYKTYSIYTNDILINIIIFSSTTCLWSVPPCHCTHIYPVAPGAIIALESPHSI